LRADLRLAHPEGTEEYFLFSAVSGQRYELNDVSYEMLRRMDGRIDADAICTAICAEFKGGEDVRADLDTLLNEVQAEGLVEMQSPVDYEQEEPSA
jgi:hypothetical protein